MPRHARQLSASGYLHLIVRGIGRQALFEEKSDYNYYLSILKRYSESMGTVLLTGVNGDGSFDSF